MIPHVDLLSKDNLTRHVNAKIKKFEELKILIVSLDGDFSYEVFLPLVVSYFEAAVLDTIKEYVYARPYEIIEEQINEFNKNKKSELDFEQINESGFENWLIEKYLDKIADFDNKAKLLKLRSLLQIEFDLGNENWEFIIELIARRNCLVHNDLISNNTYLKKAGNKKESDRLNIVLSVNKNYLLSRLDNFLTLLRLLAIIIEDKFVAHDNIAAIKNLWNFVFDNDAVFNFEECWVISEKPFIRYKGYPIGELSDMTSPRMVCLFSAWLSFFNGYHQDLKFFSQIFCNGFSADERDFYSERLKYLMNCFDKIDFQSFNVQLYKKES